MWALATALVGFTAGRDAARERLGGHGGHLDAKIDAVDERARDAAAVAGDSIRRAMTAAARVAQPAAGTGIHRGDELEVSGKRALPRGARDMDHGGLERLAQHLEHAAIPLRQFVEKQHTVMRERDLARPRIAAAADERHRTRRMVRRAVGTYSPGRSARTARRVRRSRRPRAPLLRTARAVARAGAAPASTSPFPAVRS